MLKQVQHDRSRCFETASIIVRSERMMVPRSLIKSGIILFLMARCESIPSPLAEDVGSVGNCAMIRPYLAILPWRLYGDIRTQTRTAPYGSVIENLFESVKNRRFRLILPE